MKNAKLSNLYYLFAAIVLSAILLLPVFGRNGIAKAETERLYCADIYAGDTYFGEGEHVNASYYVSYDYKEETFLRHKSVPSFGNGDTSKKNICGPLTGMNLVAYYDRWFDDLVPNYTAGVTIANGTYYYYPDLSKTETRQVFSMLYSLMKTEEQGGTTSVTFKSGLDTYVKNTGHSLSYSSFYSNAKTVNIDKLINAINQNKVGIIMCTAYNFVSSIDSNPEQTLDHVVQSNSNAGHMMMVYGYRTIAYYKDNVNFRTDTFLCVCSSYSSGEIGYIKMNDYANIDEALIVTVS